MKKVAFMFVAAMAISFASCGGQATATAEAVDSLAETCDSVVEEVVDSALEVVDSAAAEVVETAEAVVAE
ncbi:MAG: hypothetical protein II129_02860 [Paludibacteraceae bacterium]|nr:hypothetical protein [Paludibacteraceae bacterium]